MGVYILEVNDILEIHELVSKKYNTPNNYLQDTVAKVESTLAQLYPVFGFDKYPTVFDKAAILMYLLCKNHCFFDGNKRVGFYSACVLLNINGYLDNFNQDDAYDKVIEITQSNYSGIELDNFIKSISNWIGLNSQIK